MRHFEIELYSDELIDIFDSAFDEFYVTYRPNGDPQLEYDQPITDSIKTELVAEALEKFFDQDVTEYVKNYINNVDTEEIKDRLEKEAEDERCEAMASRLDLI